MPAPDDDKVGNELIFQSWEEFRAWRISMGQPDPGPDRIRPGYPVAILRKKDANATNEDTS